MRSNNGPVNVEGADGVPTQALRSVSVKELGVLVALNDRSELPPLFPASGAFQHKIGKLGPAGDPEERFFRREYTGFFQKIIQINKKTTVIFEEGVKTALMLPNLCSRAERLQPGHQIGSGIHVLTGGGPRRKGGREEEGIKKPRVLETKGCWTGDGSRSSDKKRNVIRGWAREGRKRRFWQDNVPGLVEKKTLIEPSENGGGALVRRSEKAVQKRQFEES
jgi:hypothetical protein